MPSPRLLLFLDSRSPAGAHSHSQGVEVAVGQGLIVDLPTLTDYCRGRLRTAGAVSAAFAATSAQAFLDGADAVQWLAIDTELEARTPSAATRVASRALGKGLRRLLKATASTEEWGEVERAWPLLAAPHQPLVLGAGCAMLGGSPDLAARAAALSVCSAASSAAIRLLGLDPYAAHRMVADLEADITTLCREVTSLLSLYRAEYGGIAKTSVWLESEYLARLCSNSAPAVEILADVHAREEMRLFAS